MKKFLTMALTVWLTGCVSLSYQKKIELMKLQQKGIDATVSANGWDKPASPALAGFLNLFPSFGNFYLGSGDAAEGTQIGYGIANLLLWPLSVVWGIPQAYSDADTINKRDLVFFISTQKINKQQIFLLTVRTTMPNFLNGSNCMKKKDISDKPTEKLFTLSVTGKAFFINPHTITP